MTEGGERTNDWLVCSILSLYLNCVAGKGAIMFSLRAKKDFDNDKTSEIIMKEMERVG